MASLSTDAAGRTQIQIFSTLPQSSRGTRPYLDEIGKVGQWSERAGCTGILVYADNSLADPWLVSQALIERTQALSPLVAVQPVYMHPYSVAKMISTLGFLYRRRIFLNLVAGGFKNDLIALNDETPHDARYQRIVEYGGIIAGLLECRGPVTFEGQYYRVSKLVLNPPLPAELRGDFLVSGSSDAGLDAAAKLNAIAVKYPEPPDALRRTEDHNTRTGIRIGVIARASEDAAWDVAFSRFPEDRKGKVTRQLAAKVSDSVWHKRLIELNSSTRERETYWLHPFENYHTNCPYLVGSYERVAEELARYVDLGHRTFILDIPASEEEFEHSGLVFEMVSGRANLSRGQYLAQTN